MLEHDKEPMTTGLERGANLMREAFADSSPAQDGIPGTVRTVIAPALLAVQVAQLRPGNAKDLATEAVEQLQESDALVAHWRERALVAEAWRSGFDARGKL